MLLSPLPPASVTGLSSLKRVTSLPFLCSGAYLTKKVLCGKSPPFPYQLARPGLLDFSGKVRAAFYSLPFCLFPLLFSLFHLRRDGELVVVDVVFVHAHLRKHRQGGVDHGRRTGHVGLRPAQVVFQAANDVRDQTRLPVPLVVFGLGEGWH